MQLFKHVHSTGQNIKTSKNRTQTVDTSNILQGGDLPELPGGTAIAYKVETALKSPKTSKSEVEIRWHGAASGGRRAGHDRVRLPP